MSYITLYENHRDVGAGVPIGQEIRSMTARYALFLAAASGVLVWTLLGIGPLLYSDRVVTVGPKCDTIYIYHPDKRRLTRVINTCFPADTVVLKPGQRRTDFFEEKPKP